MFTVSMDLTLWLAENQFARRLPHNASSRNRLPRPLHRPLVDRQVDHDRDHGQPDCDQPHQLVGASAVEDVAAEPTAEEAAELVEEEDETRQHGEMLHAENSRNHAV